MIERCTCPFCLSDQQDCATYRAATDDPMGDCLARYARHRVRRCAPEEYEPAPGGGVRSGWVIGLLLVAVVLAPLVGAALALVLR